MPSAPLPANELERLQVLLDLGVLDTDPEQHLDAITQEAARLLETPIATISLVDRDRQWFKSCVGVDERQTSRDRSFCAYTILADEPLIIEDATTDPRTLDNPLVTGPPGIRAYMGYPLHVNGVNIGSLCVIDTKPRDFTPQHLLTLSLLTKWAQREIEVRDRNALLEERDALNRRTRTLFENAPHPLMRIDIEGHPVDVNQTATQFWVSTLGEVPNLLQDARLDHWELQNVVAKLLEQQPYELDPVPLELADGGRIYLQFSMTLDETEISDPLIIIGFEDRTEAVWSSILEDRRKSERQAERPVIVRGGQFMAKLSHEMRNPVNGMLGVIELCKIEGGELTQQNFETLESCVMTLKSLVDETLDLERMTQGRISIEKQPFHLKKLCLSLAEISKREAVTKGLKFDSAVSLPDDFFVGDQLRVRQILGNLLSNAVKYTHQGGVDFQVSHSGENVVFQVSDSGEGISEEMQSSIFEPFVQARDLAGDSQGGLGLGLAIVKELVGHMAGEISTVSEVGKGSTFRVVLPLIFDPEQTSHSSVVAQDVPSLDLWVLVVDDNVINRTVMKAQLGHLGCEVGLAADGILALDYLEKNRVDLVLLDCQMPRLDGFGTARAIREHPETYGAPKILALTASVLEATREKCRRAGMDDYLQKPVQFVELYRKLQEATLSA